MLRRPGHRPAGWSSLRPGPQTIAAAVIAAVLTASAWAGLAGDIFAGFRRQATDTLFPSDEVDPRIVVVGIDAQAILETATPWPWPRDLQADLVRRVTEGGARMVVMDVLYDPPARGDDGLADALRAAPAAVVASAAELERPRSIPLLHARTLTRPVPAIAAAASVGHVNVTPDTADAVVRALPLAVEGPGGDIVPSAVLATVAELDGLPGPVILRRGGVQLGGRFIPTDELARLEINYTANLRLGGSGTAYRSAADVLAGRLGPGALDGRIVLIGATDPALGDSHVTPVDKGGRMPGVYIHANALNTLLTESYLVPAGRASTLAWVFGLALLAAVATLSLPLWAGAAVVAAGIAARVATAVARFDGGVVVDLVYPVLAACAGLVAALGVRYLREARQRRRMAEVLSQYVPPTVVHHLLDRGDARALPTGSITFLFTDVVGSTVTWEAHPKEMSRAMRLHDSLIEAAVQDAGGALVRPRGEGDSRFAVFVRPIDGMHAAAEIARSITEERWPTPDPVRVRMALHTGEAQLWEGDYYGSPPNRCARLRSAAEPGQILLSASTVLGMTGATLPEGTSLRPLGPLKLEDFDDPEQPCELIVTGPGARRSPLWSPALVDPAAVE